jgi:hypothetical protein
MYLNAERLAIANQAIRDTFEQTSIAWQAIPHWDTGDPAQTKVRADSAYAAPGNKGPLGEPPVKVESYSCEFYVTVAQAISPTPDALLDAAIARTVQLAAEVDSYVLGKLLAPKNSSTTGTPGGLMNAFIDARANVEDAGYRAPSCLLTDTGGLKAINTFDFGSPIMEPLLDAAEVNSRYRVNKLPPSKPADETKVVEDKVSKESEVAAKRAKPTGTADAEYGRMLLLGRRQRIAHGGTAATKPGEEPVDLAISVPPSLEVIGETNTGYIDLAVRIRLAARVTDKYGIAGVVIR